MRFETRLRAVVFAVFAAMGLSGCMEGGVLSSMGGSHGARAPKTMAIAGGALRVRGPEGYCVDLPASRAGEADGFVLLGSCRAISHHPRDPHPTQPMVLTVSASTRAEATPTDLAALEAHLRSEAGRGALSRAGDAGSVRIARALHEDGVLYLRVRDDSANPMGAVAEDCWRAFLDLNGSLVALTVTALASQPVDEPAALAQAQRAVAALRAANPEGGKPAGVALAGLADRFLGRNKTGVDGATTTPASSAARPPER